MQIWDKTTDAEGSVTMVEDEILRSQVLEIKGETSTNFVLCPPKLTLGITLPFIILQVKNVCRTTFFSFSLFSLSSVAPSTKIQEGDLKLLLFSFFLFFFVRGLRLFFSFFQGFLFIFLFQFLFF